MDGNKSNKDNKEFNSFEGVELLRDTFKILSIFCLMFIAVFFWLAWFAIDKESSAAQAQTATQTETGQDDGLAVRVMPNEEHVSPNVWYQQNIKQQGSPTRILVDGYEALQEGRTIYVNAANVASGLECIVNDSSYGTEHCSGKAVNDACYYLESGGSCQVRPQLYTNIYIISYTQEASGATREIFNQLLNNWTFNTNVIAAPDSAGPCLKIEDNSSDQDGKRCYTDAQCGRNSGLYCNSSKAKLTRDVRRLADIRDIERILGLHHNATQSFPALAAGSYIAGKTISVWPSWQATLGKELGKTLPVDPLNKLVSCVDPNQDGTCWHEEEKRFGDLDANGQPAHSIPDNLPAGSHVYAYIKDSGGVNPRLCAVMETDYSAVTNWKCSNANGARVDISNIRVIPQ